MIDTKPDGLTDQEWAEAQQNPLFQQMMGGGESAPPVAPDAKAREEADYHRREQILAFQAKSPLAPGQAMEVRKYAAALPDMDPQFIADNLDKVRAEHGRTIDWSAVVRDHPAMEEFIGDPTTAPLVIDDAATLSGIKKALTGDWRTREVAPGEKNAYGQTYAPGTKITEQVTPPAWQAALRDAFKHDVPYAWEKLKDLAGWGDRGRWGLLLSAEQKAKRDEYLESLRQQTTSEKDYLGKVSAGQRAAAAPFMFVFKNAPMILGSEVFGALGAAKTLAEGAPAVARAAALASGATEKAAGEAAAKTLANGRFMGMFAFQTAYMAPLTFDKLSRVEGVSEDEARTATIIGSPLVSWVGAKGLSNVFGATAERYLEKAGADTITKALTNEALMSKFGDWALRTGVHTVEGAAGFAMQAGMDAAVEELTKSFAAGQEADPRVVGAAMYEGFKQGLIDMPVLAGWGAGRNLLADMGRMRRAAETHKRMEILSGVVDAEKYPEITRDLARETAAKPGAATHTYVDLKVFQDTAAKLGLDPRDVARQVFGDDGAAYDEAVNQQAADLAIPIEKAMILLKSKGFKDMMLNEGRFDVSDPSLATVMRNAERWIKQAQDLAILKPDQMDPEAKAIYDVEYEKAFKAIEGTDWDNKETSADAHARQILAQLHSFRIRTGETATLKEWYEKTFARSVVSRFSVKGGLRPHGVGDAVFYQGEPVRIKAIDSIDPSKVKIRTKNGEEHWVDDKLLGQNLYRSWSPGQQVEFTAADADAEAVAPGVDPVDRTDTTRFRKIGRFLSLNEEPGLDKFFAKVTDGLGHVFTIPVEDLHTMPNSREALNRMVLPVEYENAINHFLKNDIANTGRPHGLVTAVGKGGNHEVATPGEQRKVHLFINDAAKSPLTLAHEFAHQFSFILEDLALMPDAHPEIVKLAESMAKAMGYSNLEARRTNYSAFKEERISHGFESFLTRGEVPSVEMAPVFAFYRSLAKATTIELGWPDGTDLGISRYFGHTYVAEAVREGWETSNYRFPAELTDFFKKLVTVGDAVEEARRLANLHQPIKELVMQMKPDEIDEALKEDFRDRMYAHAILLKQIAEATANENRSFMRREFERFKRQVMEEMKGDPVYRLLHFAKTGEMLDGNEALKAIMTAGDGKPYRISHDDIVQRFGKRAQEVIDTLNSLQRGLVTKDAKRAIDLGTWAQFFGFDKVDNGWGQKVDTNLDNAVERMLAGLKTALPIHEHVVREADARLRAKYQYDLVDHPEELQQKALDAVIDEKTAKKIMRDMKVLARKLDPERAMRMKSFTPEMLTSLADRLILSKTLRDIRPEAIVKALGTNGAKVRDLVQQQKWGQAWDAAEGALLQVYLYKAARAIEQRMEKNFVKLEERTTTDRWRASLNRADPEYLNLHDAILSKMGLGEENDGDLSDALKSFQRAIIDNGQDIDGWDPDVVSDILRGTKGWKDLTPTEAANLFNAVINVGHLAKEINDAAADALGKELKEQRADLMADLEKMPFIGKSPADKTQVAGSREKKLKLSSFIWNARDPQRMFERLGPAFQRLIWDQYNLAKYDKFNLQQLATGVFKDAYEAIPKEIRDAAFDVLPEIDIDLPIPPDVNLSGPRSRSWLWMVMLNMGNASNRERLLGGMGWNADQVLKTAEKHLSVHEMDFIQKVWDFSDKNLWQRIVDKEIARTGLPPDKIEPVSFSMTFADGTTRKYAGGYFPAKYDKIAGMRQIEVDRKAVEDGPVRRRAGTQKSYTHQRAESYADVVNLEWSVLPNHFAEVIHDLAYDKFVRDMNRLLFSRHSQPLRDAMYQRMGEEGTKQIRAWLEVVANEQTDGVAAHMARTVGILDAARSMVVYGALGHRVSVAVADLVHPLATAMFGVTTLRDASFAFAQAMSGVGYVPMREFAMARSKELPIRAAHANIKLREELLIAERAGKANRTPINSALRAMRNTAFVLLDYSDRFVSTQIWTAKYNEMIRKTGDEETAVKEADAAVQKSMPAHLITEMPALLRDHRTIGSLLMFHGYYNKLLNMTDRVANNAEISWRDAETEGYGQAIGKTALGAGRVAAGLAIASVLGDYLMGHGKEKDETWGEWYARKSLVAPLTMVPVASDVASPFIDKVVSGKIRSANVRSAPVWAAAQNVQSSIGRMLSNKRTDDQKIWDAVELALFANRLSARQIRSTGEYLTTVANGHEVKNPFDLMSGLVYGPPKKKRERNPLIDLSRTVEGK